MKKLIIEARVNEYAPRSINRNVPFTAEEIGREAAAVRAAGGAMLHFHARTADGAPAHDTASYAATVRAVRAASDLLINPTLGQITVGGTLERIRHIEALARDPALRPDIVGIDTGSTNIDVFDGTRFEGGDRVYVNANATLVEFATRFRALGVRTGFACWSVPFLRGAAALMEMGLVAEPAFLLLVHCEGGILGGHPATAAGLRAFTDHLPRGHAVEWSVCCKGGNLFPLAMAAIAAGGHVSIGIGDYAYPELGEPSNAALVAEVARLARLVGREIASPTEARAMLGLG